jgi:hypothetical protein
VTPASIESGGRASAADLCPPWYLSSYQLPLRGEGVAPSTGGAREDQAVLGHGG